MDKSLELLESEIHQKGVYLAPTADKAVLLEELEYSLIAKRHERKIQSYGVIFTGDVEVSEHKVIPITDIDNARRLSDGIKSFVIYRNSILEGVLVLPTSVSSELELVKLREEYNGSIFQRDSNGSVKIVEEKGIFLQDSRVWQKKPAVSTVIEKVELCAPQVNSDTLTNILNFSFHQLSPQNIGTTLVWCLQLPTDEDLKNMNPKRDLRDLKLNINDPIVLDLLKHILSETDGATLIDPDGNILSTEAHLKYSDRSIEIIPQKKGTRHTSAQRFSYDVSKVIAFTVSEDGPVTVYSDGADIADLSIFSASKWVSDVKDDIPELDDSKFETYSFPVKCEHCGKTSKIEELIIYGWKGDETESCPVCSKQIYESRCFRIEASVYKKM